MHRANKVLYLDKCPNVVMNDYTKNISESIFTPGVHKLPKTIKLQSLFSKNKILNDRKPGKLFLTDLKGMQVEVTGKIGEK